MKRRLFLVRWVAWNVRFIHAADVPFNYSIINNERGSVSTLINWNFSTSFFGRVEDFPDFLLPNIDRLSAATVNFSRSSGNLMKSAREKRTGRVLIGNRN
jgi:hypothetical protein